MMRKGILACAAQGARSGRRFASPSSTTLSSARTSTSRPSAIKAVHSHAMHSSRSWQNFPSTSTSNSTLASTDPLPFSPPPNIPGAHFYQPDPAQVTEHLNNLFEGLQPLLPPELAMRMVTHKGAISPNAPSHKSQHNARLAFLGRSEFIFLYGLLLVSEIVYQDAGYCDCIFRFFTMLIMEH